ncbi:putative MFS family arabinose efflux permease [Alteromonadaceae bacterium 2753L.S.0a.02]|nr:putative MFS family arabinose efflux permease [Alteromonadaceae bacterium 2753L.S.0a.02]
MTDSNRSAFSKALIGLYVVSFASGFSMGIFNPLISILMEQAGVDQILIGANSSLYYLIIGLASPLVAGFIRSYKLKVTIFLGILLTTFSTAVFPFTHDIVHWFILRAIMAIGVCLYMVAGQTGLNIYADDEKRGLIVALHGSAFGVGFMISPILGTYLYSLFPIYAFAYSSVVIFAAIFAVLFLLPKNVVNYQCNYSSNIFRKISIPLHGAMIYGMLEGILVTLLPILMVRQAISVSLVGLPLTLFMVSSGIGMIPVCFFSDKFGRSNVLYVAAFVAVATLIITSLSSHPLVYVIASVALGLSVGTFFPLTLAMVGERLPHGEMHTGSSMFTGVFSMGCALGPLTSAALISYLGERHMFSLVIVALLILVIRMTPKQITSDQPELKQQEGVNS